MADIWNSLINTAKKVLPAGLGFVTNAIIPGSGGIVTSLLSDFFGCEDDPESIEMALSGASQEQLMALKTEMMKHKENLVEFGIEKERIRLQDVQNARKRETDYIQVTGKRDTTQAGLSWISVFGFFGLLAGMFFYSPPPSNKDLLLIIVGALGDRIGQIYQYYFGSSKSSSDKNAILANGNLK